MSLSTHIVLKSCRIVSPFLGISVLQHWGDEVREQFQAQHLLMSSLTFCSATSTVDGGFTATIAHSALFTSVACVVSFVEGRQLLKSLVFLITILPSVILSAVTLLQFF